MKKRWVINTPPEWEKIDKLSKELNCSHVIANLLLQRGVDTAEEAHAFFNPTKEMLHDPFLMKDMDKAVLRLEKAIDTKEKVMIYGDYDVDGTTAVALLYKYLKNKCKNPEYYIPDRYTEGYGVSILAIDYAALNGISLMIVTDCGVKAVEKVRYAKSKGVDIIICDHHTPGDELPDAVAVLDPQRKDCHYPYRWLSGCGVSFKLAQAYNKKHNLPPEDLDKLLDLVCVSIASDIVPITGENRILAHFGLLRLNSEPSLGLKTILSFSGINKDLTINDIVFRIGPKINAAGRVESGNKSVELLIADDETKATEVAASINNFNDQRKKLDHDITEEALEYINQSHYDQSQKATVLYNPNWHKGVIGIVASRLTEYYYRPTVILTESNGLATGSARSVSGFDVYKAIEYCRDLLENFGGHTYAAGLSMKVENVPAFTERFEEFVSRHILPEQTSAVIDINAEIDFRDITPKFCNDLKKFNPFGPDNTKPVFCTHNVYDYGTSKVVGRDQEHIKLELVDNKSNNVMNGIAFGQSSHVRYIKTKRSFDICYTIEENTHKRGEVQLQIEDIKPN